MRIGADSCLGSKGAALLTAGGHEVVDHARPGSGGPEWFRRAMAAGIEAIITSDHEIAMAANLAGIVVFAPREGEGGVRMAERFLAQFGGAEAAVGIDPRELVRDRFPDDHNVDVLRGHPVPTMTRMKRVLAQRCAWLAEEIGRRVERGRTAGFQLEELASIVALVEMFERASKLASECRMSEDRL